MFLCLLFACPCFTFLRSTLLCFQGLFLVNQTSSACYSCRLFPLLICPRKPRNRRRRGFLSCKWRRGSYDCCLCLSLLSASTDDLIILTSLVLRRAWQNKYDLKTHFHSQIKRNIHEYMSKYTRSPNAEAGPNVQGPGAAKQVLH